jgi:hypothetical protein
MTDFALYGQRKQWLLLLLTLAPLLGLRAQCRALPVFQTAVAVAKQPCELFAAADINELPNGTNLCFRTNANTGNPVSGSLSAAFRTALLSGGGVPIVTAACGGEVEICVSDEATDNGSCNGDNRLSRRYAARNLAAGADNTPVVVTVNILFVRPQLADLRAVEEAIFVIPDDGLSLPDNPAPRQQDYPEFDLGDATAHLAQRCDFAITFQDGDRRNGCGNNFRFVRTFRVEDGCAGGASLLFSQIVKAGDQRERTIIPPAYAEYPVVFRVNTGCGATVDTRATGIRLGDICNGGGGGLNAYVYLNGRFNTTPLGPYPVDSEEYNQGITDPIPVGSHVIRYTGQDSYGAPTVLDIDIEVQDLTPPVIVCRNFVTASLGENGERQLNVRLLDGGTVDACGTFTLTAARANAAGNPTEAFSANMVFRCADLGTKTIVLQATDYTGVNRSRCQTQVTILDERAPTCTAPPAFDLNCRDFANNFPTDLTGAYYDSVAYFSSLLDVTFGAAAGADNCGESNVRQDIVGQLSNCGTGRFIRTFTVTDNAGFTQAAPCRQTIDVRSYIEYSLLMPADQTYTCAQLPTPDDLIAGDTGCDLLVVTTDVDTLPADDACYRLRLHHEIINWCEYDGASAGLEIPRDADGNGTEGQRVALHILARSGNTLTDDVALLDQDYVMANGNELGLLVPNYAASGQRGYFHYEQFISLTDNVAPVTDIPTQEPGLAFTDNCLGGSILRFTATDDCVTPTVTVALDVNLVDRNGDGRYDEADFIADRQIPASQFFAGTNGSTEVFIRNLPIGPHLTYLRITDDCGNLEERYALISVVDERAPTPVCTGIQSVMLTADADFGGIAVVYADDFISGPPEVCTETEVAYAVYREVDALFSGFVPTSNQQFLSFDCSDQGEQLLRVYAFSNSTNRYDFCNVALTITSASPEVCTGREGSIGGIILTEAGEPMANVEVFLTPADGTAQRSGISANNGTYLFDGLLENRNYAVQPYLNDTPNNGVETFDISQVSALITNGNYEDFTPYQLIAADANNSGNITVVDLLSIRAVVLGIESGFDNNTSWRFLPADYTFPDPTNPWAETFPEALDVKSLDGHLEGDFIAIKVGDINNNARPSGLTSGPVNEVVGRASVAFLRLLPDALRSDVWSVYAPEDAGLSALQFALTLPPGTQVITSETDQLGYAPQRDGTLRVIYTPATKAGGNQIILKIRVPFPSTQLPTLARNPNWSNTGYDAVGNQFLLDLTVDGEATAARTLSSATLFPNPVRDHARVSFQQREEMPVTITITDTHGRKVAEQHIMGVAGKNDFMLEVTDWATSAGIYYLRLQTTDEESVMRVVVIGR